MRIQEIPVSKNQPRSKMNAYLRLIYDCERGLTLIELAIAVAILGLLSALAMPNLLAFIGSAEEAAAKAELHSVQTGVNAMLADAGVIELDGSYDEVRTLSQRQGVTARGGTYSLDVYLSLEDSDVTLRQGYDIAKEGWVSID